MSETRETVNADMDQVIPRLVRDIASGRSEEVIFFTNMLHNVQTFPEKHGWYRIPPSLLQIV